MIPPQGDWRVGDPVLILTATTAAVGTITRVGTRWVYVEFGSKQMCFGAVSRKDRYSYAHIAPIEGLLK